MIEKFITSLWESIELNTDLQDIKIERWKFRYNSHLNIPLAWKRMNFEIIWYIGKNLYVKDSLNFVTEFGTLKEVQQFFKNKIFEFVE